MFFHVSKLIQIFQTYWSESSTQSSLVIDRFQTKTSPFSTHHLILVNYKVVSQFFQLVFLSFSYLNSVQHFSVVELCRENFLLFSTVSEKINLQFFAMDFLAFFNNAHFHIYLSWELTILWLNKIISLSK